MKNTQFNKSFSIQNHEDQEDGSIIVSGIASSEALDSDGDIITKEAMKKAIPEFMKYGNIREMHSNIAAGKALEMYVNDEDGKTYIKCKVVDKGTIEKVKEGVLKCFSIGGKILKRGMDNLKKATEIVITEVSLVDRGANPDALITFFKGDNIKKSLNDVSRISNILTELSWVQECLKEETEQENDGSKIADDLKDVIKQIGIILVNLTKEETEELTISKKSGIIKENEEALTKFIKIDDFVNVFNSINKNLTENKQQEDFFKKQKEESEEIIKSLKANETNLNNELTNLRSSLSFYSQENKELKQKNEQISKRNKELENIPRPIKAISGGFIVKGQENQDLQKNQETVKVGENIDNIASVIKQIHKGIK